MKKLVLSISLTVGLVSTAMATNYPCPQQLICNGTVPNVTCNTNDPVHFTVEKLFVKTQPGIYNYDGAFAYSNLQQGKGTCFYYYHDNTGFGQLEVNTNFNVTAATKITGSQWVKVVKEETVYVCHAGTNRNNCQFTDQP